PPHRANSGAQPPVRGSGPVEGVRGNREVPPTSSAAAGTGQAASQAAEESLEERLSAAEAKGAEHLSDLQRLAAEFDNYRKRVVRDQQTFAARASESLVKELLPVLDDLERALLAAEDHEEATLEEGVRLVHQALVQI